MGDVPDVITYAKFQIEIFIGYDFTGGRIFDFPIDFSMGLTTVQRYCAASDSYCVWWAESWVTVDKWHSWWVELIAVNVADAVIG